MRRRGPKPKHSLTAMAIGERTILKGVTKNVAYHTARRYGGKFRTRELTVGLEITRIS